MSRSDSRLVAVVDDDPSLRRSLRNLLSSVGLRVETYSSAEAFLESANRAHVECLVLDLRMPGMGGLGLLRHLAAQPSHMPVIVLTGHGDDESRRHALRAGAVAFLAKPCGSDALLDAVRGAMAGGAGPGAAPAAPRRARPIQFACGTLDRHRHVCAFFHDADEQYRVLRGFVAEGLDDGEKALHIVDPARREDHLRRLAGAGIDVERARARGQLDVVPWQHAHLRGDRFERDAVLALLDQVLHANAAAGYPRTRIVADMAWALLDRPGADDLVEYETRVNQVLAQHDAPTVCTYDLSRFGAAVAMDVMRAHPMAMIGGVLQENPFHVPPEQFLVEIRDRRPSRRRASVVP